MILAQHLYFLSFFTTFLTLFFKISLLSLFTDENRKVLDCLEPSVTLRQTPANFTSKYKSAPEFISKECKVTKKFGDDIVKVLYVFDGSSPVDLNAITSTVMNEIKGVTGALGGAHQALAGQLTSFLGSIPTLGTGLKLPSLHFS